MTNGPVEQFRNELNDLLDKWARKPQDDCLTCEEMVGTMVLATLSTAMLYFVGIIEIEEGGEDI